MKRLFGISVVMALAVLAGPGSALAQRGGSQRFLLVGVDERDPTVTASGVIDARGRDVPGRETFEDGPGGTFSFRFTRDRFVFPNGTLFVNGSGTGRERIDEDTCAGSVSGRGRWTVTGGTGAYQGARGSGTFTFRVNFVSPRGPKGCERRGGTSRFVADFTGSLSLGRQAAA